MSTDIYTVQIGRETIIAVRERGIKGRPKTVVFAGRPLAKGEISAVRVAVDRRSKDKRGR